MGYDPSLKRVCFVNFHLIFKEVVLSSFTPIVTLAYPQFEPCLNYYVRLLSFFAKSYPEQEEDEKIEGNPMRRVSHG
jgi:hypothetical protein